VPKDEKNTSCLNSRAIIEYIRHRFPDRVSELFVGIPAPYSTMISPEEYLSDENNWMSSAVTVVMFENARRITGNSNAAFDIGFESMMNRELSYFQRLFLNIFATPSGMLRRLNQLNSKLNTTKIVELVYDAPGRAVLRWHWKTGIAVSKDICEYNKGIYAAIPTIWGVPPGKIEENPCQFEGGEYCEVIISWSLLSGRLSNFLSRLSTRKSNLLNALEEIERDKTLLRQKFAELSSLNIDLLHKVDVLKSINKATRALVSITDTQKVLEQTMKPIVEVLGFDRALIMMVDQT
jgi:hypothetical protein